MSPKATPHRSKVNVSSDKSGQARGEGVLAGAEGLCVSGDLCLLGLADHQVSQGREASSGPRPVAWSQGAGEWCVGPEPITSGQGRQACSTSRAGDV